MYFEQFYLGCLAHASYLLGSQGEAVVVDPQRDVDLYLETAEQQGLRIRHIFETHLHADFVSGHKELAARTGAQIYIGSKAGATFPHVPLQDGFELSFGKAKLRVLETPGHTPESICLVITDKEKSPQPWAVLTGDTLFIGDVGRPDLSPSHTPAQLAGMLYDSLHDKLLALPDEVIVYPAHGAGSLCGRDMRSERSSTIGTERLTNYALQIPSQAEFIQQLTSNLPARPEYFLKDAAINRDGAPPLADLSSLPSLSPADVRELIEQGSPALDVRSGDQYSAGHVPGSINIALSGQFATWAGTILGLAARPILIADGDEQLNEARLRLARVRIDAERGFLAGGLDAWKRAGFKLATIPQMTAQELRARWPLPGVRILDVRREPEWNAGHLADAQLWPLDKFVEQLPNVDRSTALLVHCKSGYRSMIACALLQKAGYTAVTNLAGGYDAWTETQV
jgi:glyoxylase-like metal-dependent hydrolase (beta-lactamase superfamily II)/rhodanese-related sulfurtransferase